ncbi:MAG: UDP-N-acetylmuramate--L-alanine ligase, partial [Planctomycetaceae bacterium]
MALTERVPALHSRPAAAQPGRRVHMVGIGGSGMKALAEYFVDAGCTVSGSDLQVFETARILRDRGLRVHRGHHSENVPTNVDLVVYSPAVEADNPELAVAREHKIECRSYVEMLGQLMRDRVGFSIAGTHGKSTTTAMLASIMQHAGDQPSAIIGANMLDRNLSGWLGSGDKIIVESCEYQRHFLELTPQFAAILNIEPDHFDCFKTFENTCSAFGDFAARVADDGALLVNAECQAATQVAARTAARVSTFGTRPGADWWASDLRHDGMKTRFRMFRGERFVTEILLGLPGRHNVINALAAAALACISDTPIEAVRNGLQDFSGIQRRFEHVGSWRGMTLIDDFAHHPTAVQATLNTARQVFGSRRILCAFQPHQLTRTEKLMAEFAQSFTEADRVLIAPIYTARERTSGTATAHADDLAADLANATNSNGSD